MCNVLIETLVTRNYSFIQLTIRLSSSESQGQLVASIKCSWWKFTVRSRRARLDRTVNFHHELFIDPTNCPWVSEDVRLSAVVIFIWRVIYEHFKFEKWSKHRKIWKYCRMVLTPSKKSPSEHCMSILWKGVISKCELHSTVEWTCSK